MQDEEQWHSLTYLRNTSGNVPGAVLSEVARLEASSLWFSGHFPQEPILPGIAILSMVADVIRRDALEAGKQVRITGIRRVRFRVPIRPGDSLSISISPSSGGDDGCRQFKVIVGGETACTGMMNEASVVSCG
jgi:3-hydroxymyristoyl/3-hydroxydecanoyl-(acyl carrier protein) dehydratase